MPLPIPKSFSGTEAGNNRSNQKNEQSDHARGGMEADQAIAITVEQCEIVLTLLERHLPNTTVWVYGPRVGRTAQLQSDLDLVVFATPKESGQVVNLREAFGKSNLPFQVNLLVWDNVPESFREQTEAKHVVLAKQSGSSLVGRHSKSECHWHDMPFTDAFLVNPPIRLERGKAYPFVGMAAIRPGCRSVYSSERRKFLGSGSKFQSGDTLMARITPCLENGKVARYWANNSVETSHGSTEFIVVRGRSDITDGGFAFYLTRSDLVRDLRYKPNDRNLWSAESFCRFFRASHNICPPPPRTTRHCPHFGNAG